MSRSSRAHRGIQLPTGWRIVGPEPERILRAAAGVPDGELTAGPIENTLYALECSAPPMVRGRPVVEMILAAVTEDIRRTWEDCPRLLRDEPRERAPSRFGGLRYEVMAEPGKEWVGELIWRAVHPVVAGAPITTRLLLEERPSFTRIAVRVTADDGLSSVRGYVGAGQAQPGFLRALRGRVDLSWMGSPLSADPIRPGDEEDFVLSVLASPTRSAPVAVLSPLEDGGYVVDPDDTAWELLGRARLHVLQQHRQTFALSDALGGAPMSCYRGAIRCYFPGWSRHDDPFEHPLLVADRLSDPIMRATWLGEVGIEVGREVTLPSSIAERRRALAEPGEGADAGPTDLESARADLESPTGSADAVEAGNEEPGRDGVLAPRLDRLLADVAALGGLVEQLLRANVDLADEVERLRTIAAVRSSSTNAIERRLGRLEDILDHAFPSAVDEERVGDELEPSRTAALEEGDERLTLPDVVREAGESHADALVVLDSALASADASPYEDPERVRAILDAMARVARRRRDGALGTSLREAFGDLGIDYRGAIASSTSARLREQYRFAAPDGGVVEAEEHIVVGNTYDPRRCLRIYFSSRVPDEPRFVVGHVGRHFEVRSSS